MQLAKKRKALSKLSNQLHGVRMELKKFTGVQLSPIGIALKAALVERRRSLRILAAEAIKALEQFKATLPLGSVSKRPVAHPATLHPHAGRGPVAVPSAKPSEPAAPGTEKLPIDDYRVEILRRVADRRISVIGGETGCGKSSRIPVMLLEDAERKGIPCRIMVRNSSLAMTKVTSP